MKGNELVWRALADRALEGQRTWRNVADLAYEAGVPSTTAYLALERLESNGTIDRYSRGGLAVVSIDKLLTMLCAWRNLERDTLAWTTREGIAPLLDGNAGPYALGGADAATAILNGRAVADFNEHIVYLPASVNLTTPPGRRYACCRWTSVQRRPGTGSRVWLRRMPISSRRPGGRHPSFGRRCATASCGTASGIRKATCDDDSRGRR